MNLNQIASNYVADLTQKKKYAELMRFIGYYTMAMSIASIVIALVFKSMDNQNIVFSFSKFATTFNNLSVSKVLAYFLIAFLCLTCDFILKNKLRTIVRLALRFVGFYCLTFYGLIVGDILIDPAFFDVVGLFFFHFGLATYLAGRCGDSIKIAAQKMPSAPRLIIDNTVVQIKNPH